MAVSRHRAIAVTLSCCALIYNSVCAYLFHSLPDDPYHLALNFGVYSYFASALSILGLIGAIKEHATSVAIFANYLLIDTILCSIPRILVLTLFSDFRENMCMPDSTFAFQRSSSSSHSMVDQPLHVEQMTGISDAGGSPEKCMHIVWMGQMVAFAGIVGSTFIEFVLALQVRGYAKILFKREQSQQQEEEKEKRKVSEETQIFERRHGPEAYVVVEEKT